MQTLLSLYNFFWSLEANAQQRLAWQDAAEARVARQRSELQATLQHSEMLRANPSGQLGHAKINDPENLSQSGLL